jgi:hypothetical protein
MTEEERIAQHDAGLEVRHMCKLEVAAAISGGIDIRCCRCAFCE